MLMDTNGHTILREDYVSFELAKLLKEKGFDEGCDKFYPINGGEVEELTLDELNYHRSEFIKAPTHQMAMKWLRENYDLHIIVFPYKRGTSAKGWCCQVFLTYNLLGYDKYTNETCNSYEDAVEAALKYCLENLV